MFRAVELRGGFSGEENRYYGSKSFKQRLLCSISVIKDILNQNPARWIGFSKTSDTQSHVLFSRVKRRIYPFLPMLSIMYFQQIDDAFSRSTMYLIEETNITFASFLLFCDFDWFDLLSKRTLRFYEY